MTKKIILILASVLVAFSVSAKTKVQRVNEKKSLDVDGYWNDTDVKTVCSTLIEDCIESPRVAKFEKKNGRTPVVIIGKIKNESSERIDTSIVAKRLQTEILNSGVLEFVASKDERDELRDEKADQADHSSIETAKEIDNEQGADFMLQGSVKTIVQKDGKYTARTYDVTVTLIDIETNRIVWQGQDTSIRKLIKNQKVKF
ncbi:MAG: penicillin-binding protein activator LpoB [Treponema sp.]|nr:penicillin-binding protein activator LpoB [Treponema sp.]